ncbi:MAG: phosphatase PAP2 family protein [Lactobacillus sp.]|jgi:membrane-associated phospholipid phosphatase|nr:phosphatase PAP2 family protein [Lactobacillus sp.]MCH3906194.1 phosphatase PAP2 family protein [Lactobacillus sp.]MCH3990229.1 phosphatase PAP2 family protein [Lactobacillus sp.]MCH4069057.1 phosphatase PAP2 family protein [Lactobacillus sp.]MCI1303459.1 phosphatase PAP2 family protein [Lactobacillus sp.]
MITTSLSIFIAATIAFTGLTLGIANSKHFLVLDRLLQRRLFVRDEKPISHFLSVILAPKMLVLWDFILAAGLILHGKILAAGWALATLAFADLCGIAVKHLIKRQRPYNHADNKTGWSFPSGHILGATTMIIIIWILLGSQLPAALLAGLIIVGLTLAFARLEAGAHYPADLLGAALLALACCSISVFCWTNLPIIFA